MHEDRKVEHVVLREPRERGRGGRFHVGVSNSLASPSRAPGSSSDVLCI